MSSPASILVYGRDSRLLETRRLVLQTLGAKVYTAANRQTAQQLVHDLQSGVLVLCYTLPPSERDPILSLVEVGYPAMKTLILQADGLASTADDHFSIFAGPAALRAKVEDMLFMEAAVL
jgi:CheY-like chemotaxis protein